MKNLYLLVSFLFCLQLSAQTPFHTYQELTEILRKVGINAQSAHHQSPAFRGLVITHKLDSVLTNGSDDINYKIVMRYDEDGRTTSIRNFEKASTADPYTLTGITTLQYQDGPHPTFVRSEGIDETSGELVTYFEFEAFYDGSDRLDSLVISQEDPFSGEFGVVAAIKQVYNGDLLERTRQWFYISLFGGWIPAGESIFTYDDSDRLIEETSVIIDLSTLETEPDLRTVFTYNTEGLKDSETYYYWEDEWIPEDRTFFEYYPNDQLHIETFEEFLVDTWVPNSKYVYQPDEITDRFETIYYDWISDDQLWLKSDSAYHELNTSLPWSNVAAPDELGIFESFELFFTSFLNTSENSIVESRFYIFDPVTGESEFFYRDTFFYTLFDPSRIENILPEYLSISPNPASDKIVIHLASEMAGTYSVTNLAGQRISSGKIVKTDTEINADGWSEGIYFITVNLANGKSFVHKQIVQ